jgi:hypothetical protein
MTSQLALKDRRPALPHVRIPNFGRTQGASSGEQIEPNSWPPHTIITQYNSNDTALSTETPVANQDESRTETSQRLEFPTPILWNKVLIEERENIDEQTLGSFYAIQEWEGYVVKVEDGIVFAELIDLVTDQTRPSTIAEIPIEEFPDEEEKYILAGAAFRWAIGFYRRRSGQQDRVSRIRFRKMPLYLRSDYSSVKKNADKLVKFFKE